ncbi:MAG: hypothetical protein Q9213_007779, partial [Squamulea squamosa]
MPSYTPTQKSAIQQFTGFTHTKESVAAKQLKSHNWNIEQAVDALVKHLINLLREPRGSGNIFENSVEEIPKGIPRIMKRKANQYLPTDRYFQSNNPSKDTSSGIQTLNKLFDAYRDNPKDEPDKIGVEGSMRYLQDLGLSLEEPVVLAILTELNAPTMGELTRQGFVDGWKRLR